MEFELQSEVGELLFAILANWIEKLPELAMDKLKRMFITNLSKVRNEDEFVAALYGQNILDESPPVLSQRFPSALLRVQHAMETSMNKRCAKELVVALELSKNEILLADALNWTENDSMEIQENIKSVSTVDLAPVKVQKRKLLSEITADTVTPRHREIRWEDEKNRCEALEVCGNKIIVGCSNGQIKIYNSADLRCQTVLNYYRSEARVTCLQCTCTEIIAGYSDDNVCVWSIQGGNLVHTFSLANASGNRSISTCVRWRDAKLVVGTNSGIIQIWQSVSSYFTKLGSWAIKDAGIWDVDFNEDYVIIRLSSSASEHVNLHYFNGQRLRSISSSGGILRMALHGNHLITSDRYGTLQIWDISTGDCLKRGRIFSLRGIPSRR